MQAIKTTNLIKRYKNITAVDGLNLEIRQGELFSLLGINGAGKTTTIKILSCLTNPDNGDAIVGGYSVTTESEKVKRLIGVSPQETAIAPGLSVKENLELICGIHSFSKEKTARLTAKYFDFSATVEGDIPQAARTKPLNEEGLRSALSKLGGTPYFLKKLYADIDEGLMLPLSAINKMRNEVIASLNEKRAALPPAHSLNFTHFISKSEKHIKGYFLRFADTNQLVPLNKNIVGYSLPAEDILNGASIEILKKSTESDLIPVAELPRGAEDDNFTLSLLTKLKDMGIKTVVCPNLSAVNLAKKVGLEMFGGFGLNLYNSVSLKAAAELGIKKGVISAELSLKEQAYLNAPDFESYAFCYGRFPLMLTKNCPVKNGIGCKGKAEYCKITDRKKEEFPVVCRNGYSEILNSRPTNIADQIENLSADFGYLYFTIEDKNEVVKMIGGFEKKEIASFPFTRGLSKGGVL
jgi:putative protease